MKITYLHGDLFKLAGEFDAKYLAHGVNCQGKMGAGVAARVRAYWPQAYMQYAEACALAKSKTSLLGQVQRVEITPSFSVLNCFSQEYYGREKKQYTSYQAIKDIARTWSHLMAHEAVFMPRIGSGLGGGEWDTIAQLIEEFSGDCQPVVVVPVSPSHKGAFPY